jgi:hypothetical protein
MMRTRDRARGERGQIIVLFALVIVMLMGMVALAVDVGVLRNASQNLWNALDAGALAGASQLPADGTNAEALANQFLQENYPAGLPPGNVSVSFRCLIGSNGGSPRLSDVPGVCDPGPGVSWTCNSSICVAFCEPSAGDTCNTIVLAGEAEVPYRFGPAVGVNDASTGPIISAACRGPCGAPPESPVDIVLIIDRTGSMSGADTINAKNAAQAARRILDPAQQWLSLSLLGPTNTAAAGCATQPLPPPPPGATANIPADVNKWVPIGLTGFNWKGRNPTIVGDYRQAGSGMASAISCYPNSSTRTDLRDPIRMARYVLENSPRAGAAVTKGIIFETDGEPNISTDTSNTNYCLQAEQQATAAKGAGIEMFTIGFGLDVGALNCPDPSGTYRGQPASRLVADMATHVATDPARLDDLPCGDPENGDGDHYYCVPKTSGASPDLTNAFKSAINQLVGGTRLIQLP